MERAVKRLIVEGDKPFLPDDVMVNVLKRLSVKYLIRFQCVCKHWKNLIKKPSFIAEHLHHSSHQTPSLLLGCSRLRYFFCCGSFLLYRDVRELVAQSSPLHAFLSDLKIYGSSNGLFCLKSKKSIFLCNPATREVRQVPITFNVYESRWYMGFGFSPIINDYKIVLIYEKPVANNWQVWRVWRVYRVEVYSLRTKSWKEVEFGNLEGFNVSLDTDSANGAVFWFGYQGGHGGYGCRCVVAFDIANEVFTLKPMPGVGETLEKKLTVYENNLAMLRVNRIAQDARFLELWVMEEGSGTSGESWTWTNKYSRSLGLRWSKLYLLTIWNNEIIYELEFESDSESEGDDDDDRTSSLYMYNLSSDKFRTFANPCCRSAYRVLIRNYVESLVSIADIHVENP